MKKILLILSLIGLQTYFCHGYLIDGCSEWNPHPEINARHTSLEIHNSNSGEPIKLTYFRKNPSFTNGPSILTRARILQPGKKTKVTLLKDQRLLYQILVACPEDCEQAGEHFHWGKKKNVPFEAEESIVLRSESLGKSASKR